MTKSDWTVFRASLSGGRGPLFYDETARTHNKNQKTDQSQRKSKKGGGGHTVLLSRHQ